MNEAGSLDVVQVSPWDRQGGGEAVAAALVQGLRARGHRTRWVVGRRSSDARQEPDVFELPHALGRGPWFRAWHAVQAKLDPARGTLSRKAWRTAGWLAEPRRFADWFRGVEDFRFPATRRLLTLDPPPDVCHLHNLHGDYFDLRTLPELSAAVPTVLTLHDAWMLSGHCAHSMGCDRWQSGCGRCPSLSIYPAVRRDATAYNWGRKRDIYARSKLRVATPSRWLLDKVERSMLAPAVVDARVIPNGVDLEVFRPQDRAASRAALGLPQGADVLLFAATGLRQNPFKDYRTLRDAIGRLAPAGGERELILLAVGEAAATERVAERAEIRFVPFVTAAAEMARCYAAADVYVHAALADTFPTTVLEALACGTPVVATAVGGIPEQVTPLGEAADAAGATGVLVPPGDAGALATAVRALLEDVPLRRELGENAATHARARFSLDRMCDAYVTWYREICAADPRHTPVRPAEVAHT